MLRIPKYKTFGGKRYTLAQAFLSEAVAKKMADDYRKSGYNARVWEKSGELHLVKRFHVYYR